jgi:hypothetical protein
MTETTIQETKTKLKKTYLELKEKPKCFITDLAYATNRNKKSVLNWIFSDIQPDEKTQKIIDNYLTNYNETTN